MIDQSLAWQSEALASGETTAQDLLDATLHRIEERNGDICAYVELDETTARGAAAQSDQRRRDGGTLGPLDGIPVAVKANLAVAGLAWTAGIEGRRGKIAESDAGSVKRLRDVGAVVVGTTNLPEAAVGAITANPFFGTTANPRNPRFHAGGSSGGSAAAVADGMAAVALGTDTMGSIRIPAGWCGVAGWKPTPGLIPTSGLAPLSDRLDTVGPLARTTEDLKIVAEALTGASLASDLTPEHCTFGVPATFLDGADHDVAAAFRRSVARLTIDTRTVDVGFEPAVIRRAGLLAVEAGGYDTHRDLLENQPDTWSAEVRDLLIFADSAPAWRLARAHRQLDEAAAHVAHVLSQVDALLLPSSPLACPAITDEEDAISGDFTAFVNAVGACAVSLPGMIDRHGLPIGLQVVMAAGRDADLLRTSALLEMALEISDT